MTYTLLSIIVFFLIGLIARQRFMSLCAICFAVGATWIIGLVLFLVPGMAHYSDPLILGILMGGSAIGGLYYLASRTKKELHIFKLPYVVTVFFVVHAVLKQRIEVMSLIIVIGTWIIFFLLFLSRKTSAKLWFDRVVACCRDW